MCGYSTLRRHCFKKDGTISDGSGARLSSMRDAKERCDALPDCMAVHDNHDDGVKLRICYYVAKQTEQENATASSSACVHLKSSPPSPTSPPLPLNYVKECGYAMQLRHCMNIDGSFDAAPDECDFESPNCIGQMIKTPDYAAPLERAFTLCDQYPDCVAIHGDAAPRPPSPLSDRRSPPPSRALAACGRRERRSQRAAHLLVGNARSLPV